MRALLLAGSLLLLPVAAVSEITDPGECAPCHPAARVQWRQGVHAREGMVCVDCHGGDASAIEAEAGHLRMRRFESADEIAATCGDCHADMSRMRPYKLAVDQQVLFRRSLHGRARLDGDQRAPVCSDCHFNHQVLAVDDPASSVFAANLPRTCGSCHRDLVLTRERGLDAGVVDGFSDSLHGHALLREGTGPTCSSCHDSHGAAVPRNADVDEVCGACHEDTRVSLRAGAHSALLQRDDLSGCASCHPAHGGLRAHSPGAICADCHERDSSQIALGINLDRLLRQAEEEVARAELALFKANRLPLDARDHEASVNDARDYLRLSGARFHTFRREPIEKLARASRSIALGVQREIDGRLERRSARVGMYVLWFYAAITLAVLGHYRWRALRRGFS